MFVGESINEGSVQSLHAWKWRQWLWLPRISWMFYHLLYSLEWLCAHRVRSPKLRTWHALCTSYNDSCWISLASARRNSLSRRLGWEIKKKKKKKIEEWFGIGSLRWAQGESCGCISLISNTEWKWEKGTDAQVTSVRGRKASERWFSSADVSALASEEGGVEWNWIICIKSAAVAN